MTVNQGTVILADKDGLLVTLPFESLSDAETLLQARYHLFLQRLEYRREFYCRRCQQRMESENHANSEDQSWEILTYCGCRALHGKIPLSMVSSALTTSDS